MLNYKARATASNVDPMRRIKILQLGVNNLFGVWKTKKTKNQLFANTWYTLYKLMKKKSTVVLERGIFHFTSLISEM
jgi:hypothetical protein